MEEEEEKEMEEEEEEDFFFNPLNFVFSCKHFHQALHQMDACGQHEKIQETFHSTQELRARPHLTGNMYFHSCEI